MAKPQKNFKTFKKPSAFRTRFFQSFFEWLFLGFGLQLGQEKKLEKKPCEVFFCTKLIFREAGI